MSKYAKLFEEAKALNIEALEVYEQTNQSRVVKVFEGEVDNYKNSSVIGISIRGRYNGKIGNTFVELYDESMNSTILKKIMENASVISSLDDIPFLCEEQNYPTLELYNEELANLSTSEMITTLLSLEKKTKEADSRISQVTDCNYTYGESSLVLENSYGIRAIRHVNYAYVVLGTLAKEGEDIQSDYQITIMKNKNEYNEDELVNRAIKEVTSKLNAKPTTSNTYKTIVRNEAMASLLSILIDSFSADQVQKDLSILKDKMDQPIISDKLTIIDDPLRNDLINSSPFDDEGIASQTLTMVEKGVLKNFYHNQKTAKKANTKSNGHGYRASYASNVDIAPTNLYIENGKIPYDELVAKCGNGILITELSGLHAGVNSLTLDFSLQANGFLIEDGKITKPVNLITMSGNLLKLLNDVDAIANDIKFDTSAIGSPSILFNEATISGENA